MDLQIQSELDQILCRTVLIDPVALSREIGVRVTLATETFQRTGSFKFRAAYNVARRVAQQEIIAASSGNFGQALAYACNLLGKSCTIVMPATSAAIKIDSVRSHGATVDLIETASVSRSQRLAEIAAEKPSAYITNAYDDPFVIQGNATLGSELAAAGRAWNCIVVPVGGGGLISGIAKGLRHHGGKRIDILGAEPALGNDAARSLREGHIVANVSEPATIADGARTISLGKLNWEIIRNEVEEIVEVSEENIARAMWLLFRFANLKVEPTGALAISAILENTDRFRNSDVCCVISGGNVDPETYSALLLAGRRYVVQDCGCKSYDFTAVVP